MSLVVDTVRDDADAGTTTLAAFGTLDVATVLVLRDAIGSAADAGPQRLVVDLGGVDFMDSSGIGAVVRGLRHCQALGVAFALRCSSPQPLRLLRMTGLDRVVDVEVPPVTGEPVAPAG